jgi:hypothetical protein
LAISAIHDVTYNNQNAKHLFLHRQLIEVLELMAGDEKKIEQYCDHPNKVFLMILLFRSPASFQYDPKLKGLAQK